MTAHQAECEVTRIDYVIVEHYKEILDMINQASKVNQQKLNEITPKYKELKLKAEQLRAEWNSSQARFAIISGGFLIPLIRHNHQ